MKSISTRTTLGILALAFVCLSLKPALGVTTATPRIVSAANTFLSTLDQKQRKAVLYSFNDQEQRARWSNFPVMMVSRGGISLKEMNNAQRSAAMAVVASALSPRGFEKVRQIMEGDEVNKTTDTGRPPTEVLPRVPVPAALLRKSAAGHPAHLPAAAMASPLGTGRYSGRISITSPSSEHLRKRNPGCYSSAATTWPSISRLRASKASLRPR